VWVRNRRGVVVAVNGFGGREGGASHLVSVCYGDGERPESDRVVWEVEAACGGCSLVVPQIAPSGTGCGNSLTRKVALLRRGAALPLSGMPGSAGLGAGGSGRDAGLSALCLAPSFCKGKRPEEYQLVPLEAALEMGQVRLLIADDVGLGKTLEAVLVACELVARRRIRRILVLCPPAVRELWMRELDERMPLWFTQSAGAGEWGSLDRVVASYYHLRRPAQLERFLSACRACTGPKLPWDLLIVDEAHNLMPSARGRESDLTRMLRAVSGWFEHRVFLTATPHRGFTGAFTGLLEILDPVRFVRTAEMTPAHRAGLRECGIRRSKAQVRATGAGVRFTARSVEEWPVSFSREEQELFAAVAGLQTAIRGWGRVGGRKDAVHLAMEVLAKRLLSSVPAFADSFEVFARAVSEAAAAAADVLDDVAEAATDAEGEARWRRAAAGLGSWFARHLPTGVRHVERVRLALSAAGPGRDSRFDALLRFLGSRLDPPRERATAFSDSIVTDIKDEMPGAVRAPGEKVLVFTESLATLRGIEDALAGAGHGAWQVAYLWCEASQRVRGEALRRFCDPCDPLRVLVTTDIASEGINLHAACRYVFHFDVPWSPARVEQRIGRLDRFGQARDVVSFHFAASEDAQRRLLLRLSGKWERVRRDLGSAALVLAGVKAGREDQGGRNAVRACLDPGDGTGSGAERPVRMREDLRPRWLRVPPGRGAVDGSGSQQGACRSMARGTSDGGAGIRGAGETAWDGGAGIRGAGETARDGGAGIRGAGETAREWTEGPGGVWAVADKALPEGLTAAVVLYVRSEAWSVVGQRLHAWVEPLAVPAERGRGRGWRLGGQAQDTKVEWVERLVRELEGGGEAAPVVESQAGELTQSAGKLWRECEASLERLSRRYRQVLAVAIEGCLVGARREAERNQRRRFGALLAELEGRPARQRRKLLQERARRLSVACHKQGFLFPGMAAAALGQLAEVQQELGRFAALVEARRQFLTEQLREQVEERIPPRFAVSGDLLVTVEAAVVVFASRTKGGRT